ncbi:hypothetical protein C8035_v002130 [Colletotrichum spinosum]|uniref:Uncharacterized protein n=1 Tax=Colletotrichum spinosum TaxID=1347390 RepID=A0A4R8QLI8_9PEZI|nr:hypothetical protein C8035_v002130 [Colletotrichum spinosum]
MGSVPTNTNVHPSALPAPADPTSVPQTLKALSLQPHFEGGFFAETDRARTTIPSPFPPTPASPQTLALVGGRTRPGFDPRCAPSPPPYSTTSLPLPPWATSTATAAASRTPCIAVGAATCSCIPTGPSRVSSWGATRRPASGCSGSSGAATTRLVSCYRTRTVMENVVARPPRACWSLRSPCLGSSSVTTTS